jgi:Putative adhesin
MTSPQSFHTPGPVDVEIRNPAGTIEVTAADTDTSTVQVTPLGGSASADAAERVRVELSADGRRLTVAAPERRVIFGRGSPLAVTVTVPTGSRLYTWAASAEVAGHGRLAEVKAHTASGEVSLDEVTGATEVNSASGRVRIREAGAVSVRTASGEVRVEHAGGDVELHSASGRLRVGMAESSVRVHTASGDVTVEEASRGTVELTAASGDLRVGVRSGVVARLDLSTVSGWIRSELPVEDTAPEGTAALEIRSRTMSGNVLVGPAVAGARP